MKRKNKKATPRKAPIKQIPVFKSEAAEFEFWSAHDLTDYLDMSKAKPVVLPNLKMTSRSISLRLPLSMLDHIKQMANRRDVPYQSLMKMILADAIFRERASGGASSPL